MTTLVFAKTCSRYWRISIYEIPFSNLSIRETTITSPEYSCGRPELDAPSIPVTERTPFAGPRIRKLDVLGTPLFPLVPSHYSVIWEYKRTHIDNLVLWWNKDGETQDRVANVAVFTRDNYLHLINDRNYSLQRISELDVMIKNDYSLLCVHPSV